MGKVAIVIGHSENKKGTRNDDLRISEYDINLIMANIISAKLKHDSVVIYRDVGYSQLPSVVNSHNPDICISLHANAFDKKVSGAECVIWTHSKVSSFAETLQRIAVDVLDTKDRGIKIRTHTSQRGATLLKNTICPCVIVEPYFIDNTTDLKNFLKNSTSYIDRLVSAINNYMYKLDK